ncbi:MAG TPA: FAD-dependent oxidoreductase [Rhodospirillaceae bacterium]|nr:FAD-dependent oxidoreductase [Rhodospirillaceae bacterium]
MAEQVDTVVIGAGVVGLATARTLAQAGREVVVLEQADDIGTGTSSRNSEVIHGGIYYAKDSLKAKCCVKGKQMLYEYCASHGVEHNRIGKVIVAISEDEIPKLEELKLKGEANGVMDLEWLDQAQVKAMEPNVTAAAGLLSPSTGIVESHGYMLSLQGELEDRGGMIAFNTPVEGGEVLPDGRMRIRAGGEAPMELDCQLVVNAGGLYAQHIARAVDGIPADTIPGSYYAKGHYFTYPGKSPFNHLIYPAPVPGGLGTHSTLDLGGGTKFGPDVEWLDITHPSEIDYKVDESRVDSFYTAIRRYWPGLPDGALSPGYTGVRPKLTNSNDKYAADFVIQGADVHGLPAYVALYGIESPGLTSSLAIAAEVKALVDSQAA